MGTVCWLAQIRDYDAHLTILEDAAFLLAGLLDYEAHLAVVVDVPCILAGFMDYEAFFFCLL